MPITQSEARSPSVRDPGSAVSNLELDREGLWKCYEAVRATTEGLCASLEVEDYVVQSMPDASPAKWHLAHTSWFFETFILSHDARFEPVDPQYAYLFNSYYNAVGERIARDRRGLLSRPTVKQAYRYRAIVDQRVREFLDEVPDDVLAKIRSTFVLGLHHEQQHQELILTDLKHALSCNPLRPAYRELDGARERSGGAGAMGWVEFPGALRSIGHEGGGFAFDNETPRHQEYVGAFAIADRLVTNREFLAFIEDRGYGRPNFWLSDGWFARTRNGWFAPLYWEFADDRSTTLFTLAGMGGLEPDEPVCHVSYFEADAYARWAGCRLATEAEWETAAIETSAAREGTFLESGTFHPAPQQARTRSDSRSAPAQLFGDVWEWTQSAYAPYRGFRPAEGAVGEYNGKFMCNQYVLRGGSCATPRSHIRATYRNFFPAEARWQFSGIRLARDV